MAERRLIVSGEQVEGEVQEIRSPDSGQVVSAVHFARVEHLERAARGAVEGAAAMRRLPTHRRAAILEGMVRLLRQRSEALAAAISTEAAKPIKLARLEAARAADTFQNAVEECKRLADGTGVGIDSVGAGEGRHGMIRRFPVGPVLGISPFNFPLNLSAHKLAPAIAAGCSMVLKPASQTPSAALMLGEIALEAGLPPQALSVLPAGRALADRLIEDERFRLITFTGSPEVGWALKARAGRKKVVLELGGNAAVVIGADADLGWALPRVAAGAHAYAGQVCISVQRVFIAREIYEEALPRLVAESDRVPLGSPEEPQALLSSMIDGANATRVMEWIDRAVAAGATAHGGRRREGNRVSPTVLTGVDPRQPIAAQEAFGPVVTVAPFSDWAEAARLVNDSRYGLQVGVFTNDLSGLWRAFDEIEVGAVIHNDAPTFRVDMMPYGGVKDSGFGREGLRWSTAEMTEERLLVLYPR